MRRAYATFFLHAIGPRNVSQRRFVISLSDSDGEVGQRARWIPRSCVSGFQQASFDGHRGRRGARGIARRVVRLSGCRLNVLREHDGAEPKSCDQKRAFHLPPTTVLSIISDTKATFQLRKLDFFLQPLAVSDGGENSTQQRLPPAENPIQALDRAGSPKRWFANSARFLQSPSRVYALPPS